MRGVELASIESDGYKMKVKKNNLEVDAKVFYFDFFQAGKDAAKLLHTWAK